MNLRHSDNVPRYLTTSPVALEIIGILLMLAATPAFAQDVQRAKAMGPENQVILSDTLSGSYFVAAPLKKEYDHLLARVELLKRELEQERVTGPEAETQLSALREELHKLRETIERTKIFVPVAKVHTIKEKFDFELGPERCLVITADQVKLVGSDDSKVHCVLEKICLSADDKPADAELAAIKLIHHHGPAPEIVGRPRQAVDRPGQPENAVEPKPRPPGAPVLPPVPLQGSDLYRDLQGKPIDTLVVEGLTHEQGNSQMTLEARSEGARVSASMRSQWRRHAALTVSVPKCKWVAIRGSMRGLEVTGISTSLIVTSSGYRDRDYAAQFRIKGVRGNVTVDDFPLNLVEDVDGDVSIDAPRDFANSGGQHGNGIRLSYADRPLQCRCADIRGNLHARLGRTTLQLEGIRGRIDVQNPFGDTTWAIHQPLSAGPHRLSSVSGHIQVNAVRAALGNLYVVIATNYGAVRTNAPFDEFAEFHVSIVENGESTDWRGFHRATGGADKAEKHRPIEHTSGLFEILRGRTRPPALVILTQAGTIAFNCPNAP